MGGGIGGIGGIGGASTSTIRSSPSRASHAGSSRGESARPAPWSAKTEDTTKLLSFRPTTDLSAPVLDVRCMATIPVAVVTCGDGGRDGLETVTTKLYDLVSGEIMG